MKLSNIRKGIVLVIALGAFGLGCELIVDFDRTKIPVEGNDATVAPDSSVDATIDATPADAADAAADDADANAPDASDASDAADAADAPDAD